MKIVQLKPDIEFENLQSGKFEVVCIKRLTIAGKTNFYGKIKALRDINNSYYPVKKGALGGWILLDGSFKLNDKDESWIDETSIVGRGCYVSGDGTFVYGSLLQGVRAYDAATIINTQIFSEDTALHGNSAIYDSTIKDCDVKMSDSAEMTDTVVTGKYLSMQDFSRLEGCVVKSIGEGICLLDQQIFAGKRLVGQGSIYGDRIEISSIKNCKGRDL